MWKEQCNQWQLYHSYKEISFCQDNWSWPLTHKSLGKVSSLGRTPVKGTVSRIHWCSNSQNSTFPLQRVWELRTHVLCSSGRRTLLLKTHHLGKKKIKFGKKIQVTYHSSQDPTGQGPIPPLQHDLFPAFTPFQLSSSFCSSNTPNSILLISQSSYYLILIAQITLLQALYTQGFFSSSFGSQLVYSLPQRSILFYS